MTIYLTRKAQLTLLLAQKVTVLTKCSDFANVFLKKSANILSERTGANEHVIELEEGKQPLYRPIYSLGPVELETTSRPTWQTVLSRHQSHQQVLRFCLSASPMVAFACVSITEDSITSRSKIGIRCH